jgi:hypothetical protein
MTEHRAARLIPESADPLAALPLGPNHEGAEGRMGRRKSIPKRIRFEVFKRDSFNGEDLRLLAIEVNSYASFRSNLERWIEEAGKDDGPRP